MIVLDANVISEIFRPSPEPRVVDWLSALAGDRDHVRHAVRRLPSDRRKVGLTRRIDAALEPYRGSRAVLPFDDVAVDRYADVLVSRENAGAPISTADAQIAATCLAHGATCATRNVRDFAYTGVDLLDRGAPTGDVLVGRHRRPRDLAGADLRELRGLFGSEYLDEFGEWHPDQSYGYASHDPRRGAER